MQFTQILLTDEQALKARLALDLVLEDPERFVMTDEERADFSRLAMFFGYVAANPSQFPPAGEMAQTVKTIVRRAKGASQPQSGRNKRKARQERRQSFSKRRRQERKVFVEAYNVARERYEQDVKELEEVQREQIERWENEPKFDVLRADGQLIMAGVPRSMIVPSTSELDYSLDDTAPATAAPLTESGLVLPGSFEKARERGEV